MTAGSAPDSAPAAPSKILVGRERELATLRDALAAALAGRGSLALIGGEAGIGKTTVAEMLLAEAERCGALVLVGRCYDLAETPPHGPWVEALAHAPVGDDLPVLPMAVLPPERDGTALTSQEAVIRRVLAYLAALAATQPLVILLEDLHWADPASLDLLHFLARQASSLSLLLLTTYRADEVADDQPLAALLPRLVREARALRLDLRPLDKAAIGVLVAASYDLDERERERLIAYLAARSEGNALFLGELLRTLEGEGVLIFDSNRWVLGDLGQVPVPALLRQVIGGRSRRLGEETRRLLGIAAVIGQAVPLALWAAVGEVEEANLLDVALEAGAARLLVESSDGTGVRFVHALTREAIYEGIRPAPRRGLHRKAGEVLLAAPHPDPDVVASHLVRAGDPRAAEWLWRAGDRAHSAYAWLTAAARYEAALALAEQGELDPLERAWLLFRLARLRRYIDALGALPRMEEAKRLGDQVGDRLLAAHARLGTGQLRTLARDYRRGVPELEAGLWAVEALPATERARQTRLDPTDRSTGWGSLACMLAILGRYADARALAESHFANPPDLDTVRRLGAAPHADAQMALGLMHIALGRPVEARLMLTQARDALLAVDHEFVADWCTAIDLGWVTLTYHPERLDERRARAADGASSGLLSLIGWPDYLPSLWQIPSLVADGRWHEAAATAAVPDFFPLLKVWQATMLAWVAREQGESEQAWQFIRKWLPDGASTEPGEVEYLEALHFQRIAAALEVGAGDLPAARAWLEAHDRWLAWNGTVLGRAEGQLGWAAYHRAAGNLDQARECASGALVNASDPRQLLALLAAHRLLGEIDTGEGRHADATAHLDTALALAQACGVPYERALCLFALAELRAAEDQREDATRLLAEARTVFTSLGAAPAVARADALAARLAASAAARLPGSAAPTASPSTLSRRETEVLRLLAAGRSNHQIAQALCLSLHTVQRHVANVYLKLGAHNRAEATAHAFRQHLV